MLDRLRSHPWPWVLFFAALAVRLVYLLQQHPVPPQDTPDYDEIALNMLAGNGFVARQNWFGFELRSWRPPFYPFFLAAVYGTWGYSHYAVKVVQAFIGACTVVLLYALGRRLMPRAALLAGLLASVYGPLVAVANEVMSETWFIFWMVLSALFLVEGTTAEVASRRRMAAGGLAVGLSALTRPVGMLFLPAFAAAAWWRRGWKGVRRAIWVSLAAGLAILPWSLRNYQVHHAWVPISTQGGFILARSNSESPAWRQERGWGIPESFFHQIPSEVERDRYWYRKGLEFIQKHPGLYLKLAIERFLRFWYFFRPDYEFWFMSVLPFFAAGLRRYWRTGGFLLLSCLIGISVATFCLVLYGSARFRLPLEPFFILYAAAFLQEARTRWSKRRTGLLLGGVVMLNLLLDWQDGPLRGLLLELLSRWHLK